MTTRTVDLLDETIPEVVATVLGLRAPDVRQDISFTELGCTSLQLGVVCARLGDRLGRPVPLSQVYRTGTVESLAAWLRAGDGASAPAAPAAPAAAPAGAGYEGPTPLSRMQSYMFLKHMFSPDDLSLHVVRSWRLTGRPDRAALREAVATVHHRHRFLSSEYLFKEAPYIQPADVPPPVMSELIADTEQEAGEVLARELARPFRLAKGEIWRPVYVAVRQEHLTLFGFSVHHIALDGGAAGLMSGELARAYNAAVNGSTPELPPAADPVDVAAAHDAHLPYVDLDAQRAYWTETVRGLTPLTYPGGPEAPHGTACRMVETALPPGTVEGVRRLASSRAVTPFAVYLGAYAQALGELTGTSDFTVGTPVNRRAHSVLNTTVSSQMDISVLRPSIGPHSTPPEAIASAARAARDAFRHLDLSVPEIADLQSDPPPGPRNPLFQNVFVLQDNDPGGLPLQGLPSQFFRPRYPGVSSEIYAEIWPSVDDGGLLVIGYQPDAVSGAFCRRLTDGLLARLAGYLTAPPHPTTDPQKQVAP
ncbi:condensation domain-containing protein [Streptomyces sp. NBC_01180]|uniref:condensation domain-containing protein n=1 Tax=Streptomyces sp. NBC_01180 TaxID=2903763 RepID=UPI00386B7FAE|nr:condensation domain-containing protein [Streptomyces sp. NBC_01180]